MNVGNFTRKNFLLTTWVSAILIFLSYAESFAQTEPFIPKYNAIKRSERCFTITENVNDQFGAVWFRDRGNFDQDTTLYFVVYMGDRDSNGADGLAFVMHNDPRDTTLNTAVTYNIGPQTFNQQAATGDPGGGLGYGDHSSQTQNANLKITPSVAIEFDTWDNNDVQDGAAGNSLVVSPYKGWDHTAVVYNGNLHTGGQQTISDVNGNTGRIMPLLPIAGWGNNKNAEDNNCYAYRINWIVNPNGTQTLELWADNYNPNVVNAEDYNYFLVMRHTGDMINGVFGGVTNLRFGFTGSTGGSRNEQTICLLGGNTRPTALDDYATTSVNTPVTVDVESNDQDFDGDNLFVPTIIQAPKNGTASVITVGDANMIEYIPDANFVGTDTVQYRTCDVDSDKCYALCDVAYAIITVGCDPYFIQANEIAPYTLCVDTLAADGAAEASFLSGTVRGNLWVETFSGMNNATVDNGTTPWSFTTSGSACHASNDIRVQNDRFRVQRSVCVVQWQTGIIDISSVSDVNISIFLEASGDMESDDSLAVYYILDGGPEMPLTNGQFKDNFGSATASATGLNGSTLRIKIYSRNTDGSENYYWDDLYVSGVGAGSPPSLTFNWYEGSVAPGNFVGTGATRNGLSDTTYHIFAVDPITGCRSDTVTVTISNDSQPIPEDSIFIVQEAPFTKCELPYDGELRGGVIENGNPTTAGYSFEWRYLDDPGAPPIRVGATASNLEADDFILTVINQTTGCSGTKIDSVESNVIPPVIFPQVVSHVYSCDNPNSGVATVTAEVDGVPVSSGIAFYWYEGLIADLNAPADHTGTTVSNLLPDQDYAVIAVDSASGCTSETRTIHIDDLRQLPVPVVTSATDQISCDPSAPTGAFTSAVDDGGSNVTAGFTFNWYRGLNDVTPARPGYTGGPDVDQLPADQYRLIVENDTSGCFAVLDTAIVENLTYPEIDTATVTHVDICGSSPNGTLTVTPVGNIGDYDYRYYTGLGAVPGNLIAETASNTRTGLAIGNYTVTIVDKITRCVSPSRSVNIADSTKIPEATFTTFPQVSCDPSNPTGRIVTTVSQKTAADHTFEWFVNTTSGTPVATTSGTNGKDAGQLAVGTYALRLTDNVSNCSNVYFQNIGPNIVLPVIDTAFSAPSTFCGTAANGELHATVDGGQTDPSIFTFTWTRVSTSTVFSTSADTTNVVPGDYELVVTNDTTTCVSNPYPVNVGDDTVTPNPDITVTDNSSCDPTIANGSIEVTDVPNEPLYSLSDYTYVFVDTGTGDTITAISGSDGQQADSLFEGTYRLTITNTTTTCSNQVLSNVTDINLKPVINTVSVLQHALYCADPFQSRIAVTSIELIDGSAADTSAFDFQWTNLDLSTTLSENDALLEDLVAGGDAVPSGNYQVIALNSFGCASEPVDFEVDDLSVLPTLDLTSYANSSCNPALPNGVIVADITSGQTIDQVRFRWENTASLGTFLTDTVGIANGQRAMSLTNGNYQVTITEKISQCEDTFVASIVNTPGPDPLLDTLRTRDIDICIPPNGEIVYQVSPLETLPYDASINRKYTFYLSNTAGIDSLTYDSRLSTDPSNLGEDSVAFTGLNYETFYAIVVDEYTHCVSPVVETELELIENLVLNFNISPVSGCNDADGSITINASSILNGGAGFDIDVYFHEKDFSDTTLVSNNPAVLTVTESNIPSGFYGFNVVDLGTQCEAYAVRNLESNNPPVTRVDNATDPTNCVPANGSINVSIENKGTGLPHNYFIYLFSGNAPLPANSLDTINAPLGTPWDGSNQFADMFSGLDVGTYFVVTGSDLDDCLTNDTTAVLIFDGPTPNFTLASTPDITCNGAAQGTGQLVLGGIPDPGYDYVWYTQADTIPSNELSAFNGLTTADPLFNGMYSIRIEDINDGGTGGLGCKYKVNKQVQKNLQTITVLTAPPSDKTVCSSDNGTVYIENIREFSNAPFDVTTDPNYQFFELYNASQTPLQTSAGGPPYLGGDPANPFTALAPASYFVRTQNDVTKCYSNYFPVKIKDVTVNPTINMSLDQADFSCNGLNPSGILDASGTGPVTEYSFTWYRGNDITNPGNIFVPAGADSRIAEELTAGFNLGQVDSLYTLVITDINIDNVNDGCFSKRSMRVPYQSGPIVITDAVTDQTICGPNGEIEIVQITERGSTFNADYTTDYTVRLLDINNNVINTVANPYATFDPVAGFFTNVPAGTYYTQAQNIITGCPYGPINQAIIKDVSKKPVVNITMVSPDFACTPTAGHTGELSTAAFGGSDNDAIAGNFSYVWTDLANVAVTTDGGTPPRAIDLPEGDYKLVVTDNSGLDLACETTRTFKVTHALQEIVIVAASGTDQTWCRPNGTLQVDSLVVNGAGVGPFDPDFSNYGIDLFVGDLTTGFGSGDNAGLPGDPIDSISANTYFAIATNVLTECVSQPRQVIVKDRTQDPLINIALLSPNYSLNYDNTNSLTGILEANATEVDGTKRSQGYQYEWFRNEVSSDSLFFTSAFITAVSNRQNLRDADYFVRVLSDSTGCYDTAAINLPFVYLKPKFNPVVTAQTFCDPLNGAINIPAIYKVADSTETFNKYEFSWHYGDYDVATPEYVEYGGNGGNSISGLAADDYYIQALDTFWMVQSDPVKVVVIDSTTYPKINFNASLSDRQTSCNPNTPNGSLSVLIGGSVFDTYAYRWFDGADTTSALIGLTETIVNRDAGSYTVKVRSQTTGCISLKTYDLLDDMRLPVLAGSSSPVTNCIPANANGIANANIINIVNSPYDFYWYNGETVTGTPSFTDLSGVTFKTNSAYTNRAAGFYTVVARDTFDCESVPLVIEVKENLRYPRLTWEELSPLTHCDPAKANAVMSAKADGKVTGYSFAWNIKDGPLYAEGPVVNNLRNETYRLLVTNNVTGCSSFEDIRPTVAFLNVPSPIPSVLAHRTSCIMPNGEASSAILGNIGDYYFTYLGTPELDSLINPRNGAAISELDINDYFVFATDRTSGCVSDSIPFAILDERYVPDFDVITEPSSCIEPTGSAEVVLNDIIRPYDVRWYIDENSLPYTNGREMLYVPAGDYYLAVEGTEGCIDSTTVTIGTEVVIFNGVSANYDGLNDVFHIECIDLFPNNKVKIFNRAGELVFEMDRYDTDSYSTSFEGVSNRGPVNGNKLAVGTYFYIVDKGDGSKPIVGYLELTR